MMTYNDVTTWLGRQWRGVKPAAAAITIIEPFDDGLIEINRLLHLEDPPRSKPLPSFWS
jgi:hypothetical protein